MGLIKMIGESVEMLKTLIANSQVAKNRCPSEYNPGFCYDKDEETCKNCWKGYLETEGSFRFAYLLDIIKEM